MSLPSAVEFGPSARNLRVDTLIRLRWLAILGQSAAILTSYFGLGLALPIGWCFAFILASATLNLSLRWRYRVSQRLNDSNAASLLAFDILQLAALLALTGGLSNPFCVLFLAPVMISAGSLSLRRTLELLALTLACVGALALWRIPLPWAGGQSLHLAPLYNFGIWAAISIGAIFITIYAHRVAQEARDLAGALAATELILAREQHLTQLDGLAAAAAHELGTPLATVALVVNEMARLDPPSSAFAEDLRLLEQEVARCRTILGKLNSLGQGEGGPLEELSLRHLVEEVAAPHRHFGVTLEIDFSPTSADPICRRSPGMIYGLGNIVENAVDFAAQRVVISASATANLAKIEIRDDGPGIAANILSRLGEPYVTTRAAPPRESDAASGGLGLGLFIAKTLLERSGAGVEFGNLPAPDHGARILVTWPLAAFEAGRRMRPEGLRHLSAGEDANSP